MKNWIVSIKKQPMYVYAICITFVPMLLLNILTPFSADDYSYSVQQNNLWDVFLNEYHQYMTWTGRSVAHINVRIFLLMPKMIFNIVNAIIYTLLTVLIYCYASGSKIKKNFNLTTYIFISTCLWIFIPFFGETVLWLTGSCNYLWGTVIILLFLFPYRMSVPGDKDVFKGKYLPLVGMFFAGILAGWCNENTSGGCVLLVLIFLAYAIIKKRKINGWMISGLLGNIIGLLIMIGAPGNAIRAKEFGYNKSREVAKLFQYVSYVKESLFILILLVCLFISIQLVVGKNKKKIIMTVIFAFVALVTIFVMVLSPPSFTERALFGGVIFLIIAASISFYQIILLEYDFSKIMLFAATITMSVYTVILFSFNCIDMIYTKKISDDRDKYVISQRDSGNLDVEVQPLSEYSRLTKYNPRYGIDQITNDKDFWVNKTYAKKFGINSIVLK